MHDGEIIEYVVRAEKISISELARRLHVSRKSLYNWFKRENLSIDIVIKIGENLNHDFIKEFPEKYESIKDHFVEYRLKKTDNTELGAESVHYWKTKYIDLLEVYTDFLLKKRIKSK